MPPGAERREEADEAGSRNSQKKEQKSQFSIPQKSVGHMILFKIFRFNTDLILRKLVMDLVVEKNKE